MIKMYISKEEDGHLLMGKPKEVDVEGIGKTSEAGFLEDVVKIVFMNTQHGVAPVPCYYPNMLTKDIVKKDFLNKMDVWLPLNEYVVIDEENIVPEMIEFYRREMGKRTGIEIVNSIPQGIKVVS